MKKFIASLFFMIFANTAGAALITSNTTEITVTGQNYSTSFTGSLSGLSNIIIDIVAKGDFDNSTAEYFKFFIDGTEFANWSTSTSGLTVVENSPTLDYTLTGSISIPQAVWNSLISDGILEIVWQIGPYSDPSPATAGADFITYSINGDTNITEVSSPGVFILLLLSLGIVCFSRVSKYPLR